MAPEVLGDVITLKGVNSRRSTKSEWESGSDAIARTQFESMAYSIEHTVTGVNRMRLLGPVIDVFIAPEC
jgi:hypothetical protein